MTIRFFAVALLVAAALIGAPVATAQENARTTTAPTDGPTVGEVVNITSETVPTEATEREARRVFDWLMTNDPETLTDEQATAAYRWVLQRAAQEDVPDEALGALIDRVGEEKAHTYAAAALAYMPVERSSDAITDLRDAGATWAADLGPAEPDTSTTTSTTAVEEPPANQTQRVAAEVDPAVTLTSYDYEDGVFTLTLKSKIPTRVTLSDQISAMKASNSRSRRMQVRDIPQKRITLDAGKTTITMPVEEFRGRAALTVATSRGAISINNGLPTVNPFEGSSPVLGWFGGAGIAFLTFVAAGVYVIRQEKGEPTKA